MALDPSLVASKSESAIPRLDHNFHTAYPSPQSPPIQPTSTSPSIAAPLSPGSYIDSTMQDDSPIAQPSQSPIPDTLGPSSSGGDSPTAGAALTLDVDPQILEALRSKDRIYVLKLGETFEALIMERRQRVELTPATSYQRLLVHRCSAYYRLAPESDPVTKGIFVLATADSRIPDRRISELVPAESTAQPAFKIMRRSVLERRSKPQSHAGSVAGEDQELSDPEQSESGSLGGQSNATNSSNKKRMTIEQREAAYKEARTRIFMDFEEKEKGKDKDMSASSSTLSLNGSASTSAGGRSSLGDTDDAASSPATESEWSAPSGSNSRDKKDGRRGGPPSTSASSSRSLRNGGSFHANSSGGSSRNSRAPSPSFSYASLHDSPMGQIYDPSHHGPNPGYYPNQFTYPYPPPPTQGSAPPFLAPYPYYPQHYNPYQSPPAPQHNPSDPATPSGPEPYSPPHMNYMPHYGWAPLPQQPPIQSPSHTMHMPLPSQQPQQNTHSMGPTPSLPPHSPQYHPFAPPVHAYTYPMNGYYPPPPPPSNGQQMPSLPPHNMNMHQQPPQQQQQQQPQQQSHSQPQSQQQQPQHHQHQQPQQQHTSEYVPRGGINGSQVGHMSNGHFNNNHNSNGPRNGLGNGVIPSNNGRTTLRNGAAGPGIANNGFGVNGNKHRGPPPPPSSRSAWSYGPGLGVAPYSTPMAASGGDAVGPRLSGMSRCTSGNSSSGGNSRASSNCDEVSSTSSSTTSSSSRRTYTSTTSSQHPLPPRPDWAVGLKAQPTLAGGRHHDISLTNSSTMSPISPPRSSNGHNSPMTTDNSGSPRHTPPVSLQAQDFPPLTSGGAAPEKRTPVATGAWGNSRPILSPTNGNINTPGNAGSGHHSPIAKQEENDRGVIERPSPKAGEVISPKLVRRPTATANGQAHQRAPGERSKEAVKGDTVAMGGNLVAQVSAMSLEGGGSGSENGIIAAAAVVVEGSSSAAASSPTRESSNSVVAPAQSM